MKKKLVVVGAGGLGREVLWQIMDAPEECEKYEILGFVDDAEELQNKQINGYSVLGTLTWLISQKEELAVVLAIANSEIRQRIAERLLSNKKLEFPSIRADRSDIAANTSYGQGCIFCKGCVISVNSKIGDFFICDWNSTVGHDCVIEDFVTLYPNVNVSGNVQLGKEMEIGTGTQIIQGMRIAGKNVIGAGSVIIHDVPSNCTVVGVPARIVKAK